MLRQFRKVRRHPRKFWQGRAAEIQPLETRSLLSGTVLVTFASNTLTITGDNKGNEVDVEIGASGVIQVTGREGTRVSFGGEVSDPDEDVTLPAPTAAVGINVNLLGGDDIITVNVGDSLGTLPLKNLTVNTGDEDDEVTVNVGPGTTLNFSDVVSITTGEGQDGLTFGLNGVVAITKALTINTGADDDLVDVNVNGTLTAKDAVSFLLGDGEDDLGFEGEGTVTFEKTLKIEAGEDDDIVEIALENGLVVKLAATITTADGNDFLRIAQTSGTVDFQKGLSIDTGTGSDQVFLTSEEGTLHSGLELKVLSGSGDDVVSLSQKLLLDAALTIGTGDGEDSVFVEMGTAGVESGTVANFIKGKLTVDTGDDSDSVSINVGEGTSLAVNMAAAISTGRGDDGVSLYHDFADVAFTAGLTIDTGATAAASSGYDNVEIASHPVEGGRLNVIGNLIINTGALIDSVDIDTSLSVSGKLEIGTGTGNDDVFIRFGSHAAEGSMGPVNTLGSLTVNTGSGSDFVGLLNEEDGTTRITGAVSIVTGAGLDEIDVASYADMTIVGNFVLDTGTGDDSVLVKAVLGSIIVNGSQTVNLGDDDDCFIQGASIGMDDFRLEPDGFVNNHIGEGSPDVTVHVQTNLAVTGGTGDDLIGLVLMVVGKDRPTPTAAFPASLTTIDSGTGHDIIGADDVVFRDLKVLAGAGDDIVAGRDLTIRGTTNIDLGLGDDELLVAETSLSDNTTLAGGAGDDEVAIGAGVTLAVGKKIALNGGTGEDDVLAVEDGNTIPNTALSPVPAGFEDLDGFFSSEGVEADLGEHFASCLASFDFEELDEEEFLMEE